ncbi:MAG TPA: 16S rRNA (adenine(1518)-N(6)/adenine(1519)-N(6))-dimethyltransferase RsmA [Thermomicrobiaceae bacterium]|nr:16S rRNA (adenine(1518)-N(6)/adenine(1519)-N(6))-dimethyltransferase RsmA [Thermomicrobiaceae bacterium]
MTDNKAHRNREPGASRSDGATYRELFAEAGIVPSKSRGQNFLHDSGVIRRIADLSLAGDDSLIVEIGPGLGALTAELDRRNAEVIAVELDPRLAEHLRYQSFSSRVTIVEADALTVDSAQLTGGRPFTLVGNLPYSIATAILEHFLDQSQMPRRLVAMVQREVAQRMVARPPRMSVLSVAMRFYGDPRIALRVGSGAFVPAPSVESAVIVEEVDPAEPLSRDARRKFFRLVQAGFSQRRKRLSNALAAALKPAKPELEAFMAAAGIEPSRRAETLAVEEWLALFHKIQGRLDAGG